MAVVQDTIAAFEFLFGRRIPNYRLLGELLSTASKETEDVRSLLYMTAMSEFVRLPVCKSEATFLAVQTDLLSLLEVRRRAGASVRWDEKSESYQPVVRPKLPEWMGLTGYMIILVILFGLVPALFRDIESAYIVALSWLSPD